jgi:putative oxidoreductase
MWKRFTYGFVMIVQGVSTFSSWAKYTIDINLLFFAAWPMLAACIALYLLRDHDVKCTLGQKTNTSTV